MYKTPAKMPTAPMHRLQSEHAQQGMSDATHKSIRDTAVLSKSVPEPYVNREQGEPVDLAGPHPLFLPK